MITGYNTDVPHSGVVFHVQTEDKGIASAFIESLVYVGGQILAKKRTSYKSALEAGDSKKQIVELMDRQHRLTIAEIQSGKYDKQVPGARSAQSSMNAEEFLEQPMAPEVEVEHLVAPRTESSDRCSGRRKSDARPDHHGLPQLGVGARGSDSDDGR